MSEMDDSTLAPGSLSAVNDSNETVTCDDYGVLYGAIPVLSIVGILTVMGNSMVLLAFIRSKSLRTPSNYFLISLAISDLIMGLWAIPNIINNLFNCDTWMRGFACEISGYIDNVILTNSLMTLAACSYDRYLLITKPLIYKREMTGKKIIQILFATWILSMAASLPPFFGIGKFDYSTYSQTCALTLNSTESYQVTRFKIYFVSYIGVSFVPPLSIMIFCYYKIFQTAKMVNDNNPSLVKKGGAWRGIKNFKAGLMIAVIIGVYLIFVLPVSIMALIQIIFNLSSVPKEAALVVTYLLLCNSFCNPIIYGIMNKEFRQEFKNILRCTSNRSFRQQNMRRESLAFSSSCNVSVLVKKPSTGGISGITQLATSTGSSNCSSQILTKPPLIRTTSELKRYISGKRGGSDYHNQNQRDQLDPLMCDDGTIMELSEVSAHSSQQKCHTELCDNGHNGFNPFKFIWNLKSASYECLSDRSRRRQKTNSF